MENIQRRYFDSWHYNACLILTELEKIVKNNGGKICATWHTTNPPQWMRTRKQYLISNRSITEAIKKEEAFLNRFITLGKDSRATREKIAQLENIDNTPVLSYYGDYLYISFVLDNNYYYFSMDHNPFFEFYIAKRPVNDGKINGCYYSNIANKDWLFDWFLSFKCSKENIKEAANLIYNMLILAKYSTTYRDKYRSGDKYIIYLEDGEQ